MSDDDSNSIPDDFDWVTALPECSPALVFEMLKQQVINDVEIRNGQRRKLMDSYKFEVASNGDTFTVVLTGTDHHRSVTFRLKEQGIMAVDENDNVLLDAFLTLDEHGRCRPKINHKDCEWWHLRKMALEQLFVLPVSSS